MTYHFDPDRRITRIVLVGCGGTGSEVARLVARILYDMKRNHLETPSLLLIDDDVVSDENLGRQLFAPQDINLPKAAVLAQRFNAALGLNIEYRLERFNKPRNPYSHGFDASMIIGAVDNHKARRAIASIPNVIWIDAGNHYTSGQVIIGNSNSREQIQASLQKPTDNNGLRYIPNAALVFPELLRPEPKSEQPQQLSCAELVARGQQHLLINNMVASVVGQYVYRLLHRQPITSFCTYVSAEPPSIRSLLVSAEEIQHCIARPADADSEVEHPTTTRRTRMIRKAIHTDETDPVLREILLN